MRRWLGLVGMAFVVPVGAAELTVDDIVSRNIAARGGAARLQAMRSLRLTGKAIFGGDDSSIEARWAQVVKKPGLIRSEVSLQGLTAVNAWDGKEGWSVQPFSGRREPERTSPDDAKGLARDADLDGPLVGWREKGHRVEYLGTEDVDGTPAHKLRVTLKDGDTQYLYLDPDAWLEVRVVTESHVRGVEQVTETDLGAYEQVAGVFIPFSIESGPKGRPRRQRITVERAEPNVEADEASFHIPAKGAAIGRAILAGPAVRAAAALPAPPLPAHAPVLDAGVISGLGARNIGSATMSGRISAVAARNEGGKTILYVGAASGGVWRSLDGGTTFKPVFDKNAVQSIGAVTIDPSHPSTLWVGTGESWTRNSVSVGDGIYRSNDAGETWIKSGLPESERTSRIIVDPGNGDVVYACVPGKLWSDSAERGVYKTEDGGKSWALVLKGANLSTGCSSLAMDPKDPKLLLAGMWDFRRKGWTFRSGGDGPGAPSGSGLFRSNDGGRTWTPIAASSSSGLPAAPWGRVEVTIAPSDPKVVYALVESKDSALYRSADGGQSWEARDNSQMMIWRPFYFARLVVDPTNPERVFKPDGDLIVSDDGGRTFTSSGGGAHGDWHDIWVDPDNPKHVIGGDDGGLWISWDGGNRWWKTGNLPVSQFYHVSVDDKDPYDVYGGLQDNACFVGPSAAPGGISNAKWENYCGGDGFFVLADPTDPDAIYLETQGGHIQRVNRRTGAARDIQPQAGYSEKLRFNWNTPIHASPTQKGTLYIGAQFLFRSRDRGDTWERVSPDLTTNDPEKQKQEESGGITVDNSVAEMHTTIYSISESPKDAQVLWVGTDDGNLQRSRDGGQTWTNVVSKVAGLPPSSWVSWVEASRFDAATAYVAFDRHSFGDLLPWVYRTTDFGETWVRIASPEKGVRGYAHVVKEDVVDPSLLFVGTEFGLWISVDAGGSWAEFKGGDFPSVAVRDVQVHPREHDLVIATHGRGIWIVDDITPLRSLSADLLAKQAAFLPGRPVQQRMPAQGGWVEGDAAFVGPNPAGGAVITYYQRSPHLYGPIKLEILDAEGKLVDTISASKRRGLNRVSWSMRVAPPRVPRAAQLAFYATQGPRVLPGSYTLRLTKGREVLESKLEVGVDRRAPYAPDDRKQQFEAAMRVHALFGRMSALVEQIAATQGTVAARAKGLSDADALATMAKALSGRLEDVRKKIVATREGGAITGEERLREHADNLYGAILSWEGRPARYQLERIDALGRELDDVAKELDSVLTADLASLNQELRRRHLEPIAASGP
jgi:photosystem II stability/assembly factor-like uncharacterized protein